MQDPRVLLIVARTLHAIKWSEYHQGALSTLRWKTSGQQLSRVQDDPLPCCRVSPEKRDLFRMTANEREKRSRSLSLSTRLRPVAFIVALLVLWQIAVSRHPDQLLPGPWAVVKAIGELLQHGLLLKYVVASVFRVTGGFALAAVLAIPLGLTLGWYRRGEMAIYPLVEIFLLRSRLWPGSRLPFSGSE